MAASFQRMRDWLYAAVVCDALDSIGLRHQSPRVPMPPQTCGQQVLVGRCKTTLWEDLQAEDPSPYELELRAVDECQPDDVFIAATNQSSSSGIWGELLTTAAINGGCVGAVTDGAVRDVTKIEEMNFPVFATTTCVYDSLHRQRVVDLNLPVDIGGVIFSPGDLLIADRDGMVVVPQAVEDEVIQRAFEKVEGENATRIAIKKGMKATEAYQAFGVL
ncbi:MAG: RraA family protein [Pirellulaceae bacterium]|nr:RraA family protein [Pirellulaceae bacterium]